MAEIRSVTIRRFKRLEHVTFNMDLAAVFVGGNNSGKSSILQALHFAVAVAQSASLVSADGWNADKYCAVFRPEQLIYAPSPALSSLAHNGVIRNDRATWIEVEIAESEDRRCLVAVGCDDHGNILLEMKGEAVGREIQDISRPYTIYVPGLAGIARQEPVFSQGVIRRIVARGDANLVLRNVLFWLFQRQQQDANDWEQFQNDIRTLFPSLTLRVEFTDIIDEHIRLTFSIGSNAPELPLDCAGTGVLQAMQVLAYINLFKPRLLLLDEPDSHMHPNNQAALCSLLIRLATERRFQLLVATHSRHVFSSMRESVPVMWIRNGVIADGHMPDAVGVLLDIGALDSFDLLGHPDLRCVVLTEDARTEVLACVLGASGFDLRRTVIASYNGCSKVDAACIVAQLLRDKAPQVQVIVHRDRDYLGDDEVAKYEAAITASGAKAFVTTFSDIEGYLLSAEHIHAAHPAISNERAAAILQEATAGARAGSIEEITNLRYEYAHRRWRAGVGHQPNPGRIAADSERDYDANPIEMRRGKRVLAQVKLLLQRELGGHAQLTTSSGALDIAELRMLAENVWPARAVV